MVYGTSAVTIWATCPILNTEVILTFTAMLFGVLLFVDFTLLSLTGAGCLGVLAALGTTLAWVCYTKVAAGVQDELTNWDIAAINNTALLLCAVGALVIFPPGVDTMSFAKTNLLPAVLLSVGVPIGYALFSAALRAKPVFAISIQNIELGITVILSSIFLAEALNPTDIIGACIVVLGLDRVSTFESGSQSRI